MALKVKVDGHTWIAARCAGPNYTSVPHHGEMDHLAYLERPFVEARAAIHRRMHQLGIPH